MHVSSRLLVFRSSIFSFGIMLLASCGGGGGGSDSSSGSPPPELSTLAASDGPGDADNLFPLSIGDMWYYGVAETDTDTPSQTNNFMNVVRVTGTQLISGIITSVVNEDNADGQGLPVDYYYEKLLGGVNFHGTSDTSDMLTKLLVPYAELIFPLVPGSHFTRFSNLRRNYPEDLDGDGINESMTINESIQTTAIEGIQVSAGNFSDTRKVVDDLNLTITLSSNNSRILTSGVLSTWYAPAVGIVKQTSQLTIDSTLGTNVSTSSLDLKGYNIGSARKGIQPEFSLAISGLSQPSSPCIAYGGGRFLVVFYARQGFDTKLFGMFISDAGVTSDAFVIVGAPGLTQFSSRPVVTFDGTNFLIAYGYMSRIYGMRIAADGSLLDSGAGFAISSIGFGEADGSPAIAFDGANYLVVWSRVKTNISGLGGEILGSVVTPGGLPGGTIVISSDIGKYRDYPSISYGGGNYLIAWVDGRNAATNFNHIYAARVAPQGNVLDPEGFPVTETASYKDSVRTIFNGSEYQIAWCSHGTSSCLYHTKYIAQNGQLIGQPAASAGDLVDARNVARQGDMWVGGEGELYAWSPTYNAIGSTANTGVTSLVAWEQFGVMNAAFIYPRH